MKTGWAILLCFSVWFSWTLYQQHKAKPTPQQVVADYNKCIQNNPHHDSLTELECMPEGK